MLKTLASIFQNKVRPLAHLCSRAPLHLTSTMSSDGSDDDANIPSREECEQRCQEFATVTGTDTALAMFYLQDRDWQLERALNGYFEANGGNNSFSAASNTTASTVTTASALLGTAASTAASSAAGTASSAAAVPVPAAVDPKPNRIRVMSWNIDGLDQDNLNNRTLGVCKTICVEDPDVVYLQEVVPATLSLLEERCPQYQIIPGGNQGYFTAMMFKVASVTLKHHEVIPFHSSVMMRNLLKVQATVKGVDFTLLTSHLESTKEHGTERKKQLRSAFKLMTEASEDKTVIFGGDLNMRDKEVAEVGGLPEGVVDLWEVTGKRPEARYTWDISRNDNLEWSLKFRPKCRFDRLYLRQATPAVLKPVYFELVGLERLKSCQRFPSDHWGLLAHFDKKT